MMSNYKDGVCVGSTHRLSYHEHLLLLLSLLPSPVPVARRRAKLVSLGVDVVVALLL